MIKRRNFIWLVPLVLVVTFPLWRIPVGSFLTPRGGYDPSFANIDEEVQNFVLGKVRILQSKNGKTTAKIRATTAKTSDVPNEYILTEVDADIINQQRQVTNVVAQTGVFNGNTNILTLRKDVIITKLSENQQLFTELFYYNDRKQTIHCPGPTRLVGERITVNGSSFDYDVEAGHYEVGGRVHTLIEGKIR